jgi:maltooligosyltrehalose synthase
MCIPVTTYGLQFNPSFTFGNAQDIVLKHMAYHRGNQLLLDVLENIPHSRYFPVTVPASEEET